MARMQISERKACATAGCNRRMFLYIGKARGRSAEPDRESDGAIARGLLAYP